MPLMVCLTTTTTEKNSTYYYNITTTTIITTTTYKKERATKIRTFFEHISWSRLERRKNVPTTNVYFTTTDKETKINRRVFTHFGCAWPTFVLINQSPAI